MTPWQQEDSNGDWVVTLGTGRHDAGWRLSLGASGSGATASAPAMFADTAAGSCRIGGRTSRRVNLLRRIASRDSKSHSNARYRLGLERRPADSTAAIGRSTRGNGGSGFLYRHLTPRGTRGVDGFD